MMGNASIEPDQKLYRFVSFFDLYDLLKRQEYRLTPLVRFQKGDNGDINEGVGIYLKSKMRQYVPMMERDDAFLKVKYEIDICSTYISSWTKNRDKTAMWYHYSQHRDRIRIATSVGKLKKILLGAKMKNSFSGRLSSSFKIYNIDIVEVDYIDLQKTSDEVQARNIQIKDELDKIKNEVRGKPIRDQIAAYRNTVRDRFADIEILGHPLQYKDRAYDHESEVRAIVKLDAADEDTDDRIYHSFHSYRDSFDHHQRLFPDDIYLKVGKSFIEEICFDPRCEEYKAKIFKQIIGRKDLYVKSKVFGSVLETVS
jgi:hypothetical protein